jgi:hypothetical protein
MSRLVARCYEPAMLHRADRHVLPLFCYSGRSDDPLQPEEGLLVAVLEQAVGIFQRHALALDRRGHLLFTDIDAWFASNNTDYPFAFVTICAVLGLDVGYVRSGLREWRESRQASLREKPYNSRFLVRQAASHAFLHLRAVPPRSGRRPARVTALVLHLPLKRHGTAAVKTPRTHTARGGPSGSSSGDDRTP